MNDKLRNILTVVLLVLLGTMQATAVEYKNQYKVQRTMYNVQGVEAPSVTFRSTSVYSGQWSEQGPRLVNEDGSVNHEAYMPGSIGPRKNATGNPGTPGDEDEEEGEQQPLGDALLPLMIFACAYLMIRATRKKVV